MISEHACGGTMKFRLGRLAAHRFNWKPFRNDAWNDLGSRGWVVNKSCVSTVSSKSNKYMLSRRNLDDRRLFAEKRKFFSQNMLVFIEFVWCKVVLWSIQYWCSRFHYSSLVSNRAASVNKVHELSVTCVFNPASTTSATATWRGRLFFPLKEVIATTVLTEPSFRK